MNLHCVAAHIDDYNWCCTTAGAVEYIMHNKTSIYYGSFKPCQWYMICSLVPRLLPGFQHCARKTGEPGKHVITFTGHPHFSHGKAERSLGMRLHILLLSLLVAVF